MLVRREKATRIGIYTNRLIRRCFLLGSTASTWSFHGFRRRGRREWREGIVCQHAFRRDNCRQNPHGIDVETWRCPYARGTASRCRERLHARRETRSNAQWRRKSRTDRSTSTHVFQRTGTTRWRTRSSRRRWWRSVFDRRRCWRIRCLTVRLARRWRIFFLKRF